MQQHSEFMPPGKIQVKKYFRDLDPEDADHPTIHGLRCTGILARDAQNAMSRRRISGTSRLLARRKPAGGMAADRPANIGFRQLVDTAKLRWHIERDYHELKQEIGLGHFEGRGWRGFHHHATLCIAAYGFLVSERETIPPSATGFAGLFKETTIPENLSPEGVRHRGLNGTFQIGED
jgi:hypothetical protein